jgi:hypothetical protein
MVTVFGVKPLMSSMFTLVLEPATTTGVGVGATGPDGLGAGVLLTTMV